MSLAYQTIPIQPHHIKQKICGTRARYRDGKRDRAVKVYTINQESVYLIISNVPAIGGSEELRALCDQYGLVDEFQAIDDYPSEEFTETYLVKYNSFPPARTAKKQLDDRSFFGHSLHVFYAPEFETPIETSIKLQERRKYVAWKTKTASQHSKPSSAQKTVAKPKVPSVAERNLAAQPVTYVWAGKEYTAYPNAPKVEDIVPVQTKTSKISSSTFVPRQLKQKASSSSSSLHDLNHAQNASSSSASLSNVDESSYLNTVSHIRSKISGVSVPNVRVSLKRKRRV